MERRLIGFLSIYTKENGGCMKGDLLTFSIRKGLFVDGQSTLQKGF